MKIGGKTQIKNSQVIESVKGDANLSVGIQAEDMPTVIEALISLMERHGFEDEELEELIQDAKNQSIDKTKFTERLSGYFGKLRKLYEMGKLAVKYGEGSLLFFNGLGKLLMLKE